jgi:hypothetical protein
MLILCFFAKGSLIIMQKGNDGTEHDTYLSRLNGKIITPIVTARAYGTKLLEYSTLGLPSSYMFAVRP